MLLRRRRLGAWHLSVSALIVTVLAFTVGSVVLYVLSERAGQRAVTDGALASLYESLEAALLREEVARHELMLEGGSSADLAALQLRAENTWDTIESSGDEAHAAELGAFSDALNAYQSTVSEFVSSPGSEEHAAVGDATDSASREVIAQAEEEAAEHREIASDALREMRARQELGARLLPLLGALALLLVGSCVRVLSWQRRSMTRLREEADERSVTDELTGLANRAGLRIALDSALGDQAIEQSVALLLLDLDGFKAINDAFGHELGDDVLNIVAERVTSAAPASSFVARLGGDEFVVLLRDADREDAQDVAREISNALSRTTIVRSVVADVGASIGISLADASTARSESAASDLLRHADIAMYAAKSAKAGPVLFSDLLTEPVTDRGRSHDG